MLFELTRQAKDVKMQCVNNDNWSYSYYQNKNLRAQISLAADEESLKDENYLYILSVTLNENKEIHQEVFSDLSKACWDLNSRYGDWIFVDPTEVKKDGCSSCAAH